MRFALHSQSNMYTRHTPTSIPTRITAYLHTCKQTRTYDSLQGAGNLDIARSARARQKEVQHSSQELNQELIPLKARKSKTQVRWVLTRYMCLQAHAELTLHLILPWRLPQTGPQTGKKSPEFITLCDGIHFGVKSFYPSHMVIPCTIKNLLLS